MADHIEVLREMRDSWAELGSKAYDKYVAACDAAIRALSPAGGDWVMVPRKADDAMKLAGWKVIDNAGDRCHQVWGAMLAASPQQEPGAKAKPTYQDLIDYVTDNPSGQTLAGAGGDGGGEALAWMHEDDASRVISARQKSQAIKDGGASASSVAPYTIALAATSAGTTGDDSEDAARLDAAIDAARRARGEG